MLGVDLKKAAKKKEAEERLYKSPEDYKELSPEERKKLTEEMKSDLAGKLGGMFPQKGKK